MNKKYLSSRILLSISISTALCLPLLTFAAAVDTKYTLLAPLGPLVGDVTLIQYLDGIMNVIIGVAGILAVIMIVICGVQLVGSPSVSQKSASKDCITSALFGLLLAISSWIILNTINSQLLSNDIGLLDLPTVAVPITPAGGVAALPKEPGIYFRYKNAAGTILNSPSWPTLEACQAAKIKEKANGSTIEQTPPGSNLECWRVFKSPTDPAIPPGNEVAARDNICGQNQCLDGKLVDIPSPTCPPGTVNGVLAKCTNVVGLDAAAVAEIQNLANRYPIKLTGGTEPGHKSHAPGASVFDLGKTTALTNDVLKNATQSATSFGGYCRYLYDGFWFTNEGNHWHVCKVGQPGFACSNNDATGKPLKVGIYSGCPLKL